MHKCSEANWQRSLLLSVLVAILCAAVASAVIVLDNSTTFDQGTFVDTEINGSFIQITTNATVGQFTSKIFDAGRAVNWRNISWTPEVPYQQDMPNNRIVESILGGVNMTGNVLLMHFNNLSTYGENATRIYDFAGLGNNASCTTTTCPVVNISGKLGYSRSFDGTDDMLTVSHTAVLNPSSGAGFTQSAWINSRNESTQFVIVKGTASMNRYYLLILPDGNVRSAIASLTNDNTVTTTGVDVIDGNWHHVVSSRNLSGSIEIYIDGQRKTVTQTTGAPNTDALTSTESLTIGKRESGSALAFNGSVDELAVWNRTLSAAEILSIYKRGAMHLNISARSCDDSACSGDSFTNFGDNSTSSPTTLFGANRYFQYKIEATADNRTFSPQIYNVTINYKYLPSQSFNDPTPANNSVAVGSFQVNASIFESELSNITWTFNNISTTYGENYVLGTPQNLKTGMVLLLHFDNESAYGENATRAYDFSGFANNATCVGSNCSNFISDGKYGGAYQFDGVNDGFTVKNNALINITGTNVTVSTWVKIVGNHAAYARILDKAYNSGFALYLNDISDNVNFYLGGGQIISSSAPISRNVWHHVLATSNQTHIALFIDGSPAANPVVRNAQMVANNYPLSIGFDNSTIPYSEYFNGSIDEVAVWNRTLSMGEIKQVYASKFRNYPSTGLTYLEFNSSVNNMTARITAESSADNVTWNVVVNQSELSNVQVNSWQMKAIDVYNYANISSVYYLLRNEGPFFKSITQNPSAADTESLDPGTNVSVTANVSDTEHGITSVVLQWVNETEHEWTNITMENTTSKESADALFNATLRLPSYGSNITYRIFIYDSYAISNYSSNYTLESFYDCSWTVTGDLGGTAGFGTDVNKHIGNISVTNTGDAAYSNNNCTLNFRTTYSLAEGRVYVDGSYFKPSNTFSLGAKESSNLSINATFLSEVKEEAGYITTSELLGISSSRARNTTFTLVSTTGGPYLYQKMTSYPTSLYLKNTTFSLEGYVRNLVADDTAGNTAYNVTFNWTLPSGFLVSAGVSNVTYENISNSSAIYNNMNITFNSSNLNSLGPGTISVDLRSQGFNATGDSILHFGNKAVLSDQVNITLLCYSASDGIYVSACGSLDGDYVAPTTQSSSSSSGGSGGGGGGSAGRGIFSKAEYQFTRGGENTIILPLQNKDANNTLRSINVELSGNIAKYISVKDIPAELLPGESASIKLVINSPTYIPLGLQTIEMKISGKIGVKDYLERKVVAVQVNDISAEDAQSIINNTEALIARFKDKNLTWDSLDSLLADAKASMESLDYSTMQEKIDVIEETLNNGIEAMRIHSELSGLVILANEKQIDVSGTERLLKLTMLSIERQDYAQALERANEALTSYALETKGELGSVRYYLKNNPKEISLAAIILGLLGLTLVKSVQISRIRRNIKALQEEEKILNELIKVVQKHTFKDKAMSMEEYEAAMKHYETRLAEVISELIQMETRRVHWLKPSSKDTRLKMERQRVVQLIKNLQDDYMRKKRIETKSYELRLESYNKRIGEIDEALANLEAQQAVKKMRLFR